jgi:hypothetical protein
VRLMRSRGRRERLGEEEDLYLDRFYPAMNENDGPELARITVYFRAGRIRGPFAQTARERIDQEPFGKGLVKQQHPSSMKHLLSIVGKGLHTFHFCQAIKKLDFRASRPWRYCSDRHTLLSRHAKERVQLRVTTVGSQVF